MKESKNESVRQYLTILTDGKLHKDVPEGTEGEIKREVKDKQTGVVTGIKNELVFDEVSGIITNISFKEGKFGTNIQIEIDKDGVLSLGTASEYGEDIMKKIPNIDLSKEVKIVPYSFTAEGKSKKGVTIYQDGNKIGSFYFDPATKTGINGIPLTEGDTSKFTSDDWKLHFMLVRKFLVNQLEALITEKFPVTETPVNNVPTAEEIGF